MFIRYSDVIVLVVQYCSMFSCIYILSCLVDFLSPDRYYPTLCINDMIYYQNIKIFNFKIILNINNNLLSEEIDRNNFKLKIVKYIENTFNLENSYNNIYSCKN